MKPLTIRTAKLADAPDILDIYGYYVANTAISMEYEVPSLKEFENRIASTLENYPYLVAEQDGKVIGYAYAGRFHPRVAFYRSAEVSIYIHKDAQKCGLGRRLYEEIEVKLSEQGILNAYASIAYTEENITNINNYSYHILSLSQAYFCKVRNTSGYILDEHCMRPSLLSEWRCKSS